MKQLNITILLTVLMSMFGAKANAQDIAVANKDGVTIYYNWINDNTELAVTCHNNNASYSGEVVIPTSVTYNNVTYRVTSIGGSAFGGCSDLTSVTIPNSITSIVDYAFRACSGLTSVHISDLEAWCKIPFNVHGTNPLYYAHHLYLNGEEITDLVIPNSVATIGNCAFYGCSGLTSVTIGNSVTSIGERVFQGCTGLTSVTIGNSVTRIGDWAFLDCSGLTSVSIGNSVTSIGDEAFRGCSGLISVTIPNSVTEIYSGAFYGCINLTDMYCYAEDVPTAGDGVFWSSNIGNATLHVPASSIEAYSTTEPWSGFKAIVALEGGGDDNVIGGIYYEFDDETQTAKVISNPNLYSGEIVIPATVTYQGTLYTVTSIGNEAFYGCSGLTSVTIPNSVTSIGDGAFIDCSSLPSMTIPNSVTSIGKMAFYGCSGLTSVTMPNSVTKIGPWAFADCTKLTSVTIPNNVTSIGDGTFGRCSSLTSVTIPNSVTSIGEQAFDGCSSLASVTIPNSVTSIGQYAFINCHSLTDMYCYAENVPTTGPDVFGSSNIGNATLHVPAGSIEAYSTTEPWSGFKEIVALEGGGDDNVIGGIYYEFDAETQTAKVISNPNLYSGEIVIPATVTYQGTQYTVTSIGDEAFKNCSGLTSITIPNSLVSIDANVFEGSNSLTAVHISDMVAWLNIGVYMSSSNPLNYAHHLYLNGEEITELTIPNSITSIRYYAFEGCSGLISVVIPNSVTIIANCAFENCTNLTSVTIPNSVTSIGDDAFDCCSSLASVTIPNSVASIGKYAFSSCTSLAEMYCYAEDVPTTGIDVFQYSNIENATLYVPAGSVEAYSTTEPWSGFKEIVAIGGQTTEYDEIQLISTGKGTYCSAYDLDFTNVEGLKVYIASGYDDFTNTIWLTRMYSIPAGTGIVLKGEPNGHYQVPRAESRSYYANMLVGNYGEAYQIESTTDDYKNFVMKGGQFVGIEAGTTATVGKNRAYLQIPSRIFAGTRSVNIGYDEGDGTTEINSIEKGKFLDELSGKAEQTFEKNVYYNMNGQRVEYPKKGFYIRGSKKIIVK